MRLFAWNGQGTIQRLGFCRKAPKAKHTQSTPAVRLSALPITIITKGSTATDAFIVDTDGTMHDLNEYLPANSGWILENTIAINDNGVVAGTGSHNGDPEGYEFTLPTGGGGGGGGTTPTTISLQANLLNAVYGQPVTVTAVVG